MTIHSLVVISGSPDTIVGSKPAERLGDLTAPCPLCKTPPGKIVLRFFFSASNSAMTCMVLPRPMSSARQAPRPSCESSHNQFTPVFW